MADAYIYKWSSKNRLLRVQHRRKIYVAPNGNTEGDTWLASTHPELWDEDFAREGRTPDEAVNKLLRFLNSKKKQNSNEN